MKLIIKQSLLMKKFSLISPQRIRAAQTNKSKTKCAFRFPQQQRFQPSLPICPVNAYDNKSQLSLRKVSVGNSIRSDFTKSSVVSPASNMYQKRTTFELSKGKSFSISRESSPQHNYMKSSLAKIPGPGEYEHKKDTLNKISYTMRPRRSDFIQNKITSKDNPGPGHYEPVNAFPVNGKPFLSKFSSSKCPKIDQSKRFSTIKQSPSPSTYDIKNELSKLGRYALSKHFSRGTRPFPRTARTCFVDQISKLASGPGPGLYQKPSQFGLYGDYKYYKNQQQTI